MTPRKWLGTRCQSCGKKFDAKVTELSRGGGKYCSRPCYYLSNLRPVAERFWDKVHKTAGCWIWTGAKKQPPWRYGTIGTKKGRAPMLAHRLSWQLHVGPIPPGTYVLHRCDNPPCVRPDHLFLGTLSDNTQDMLRKGRHRAPGRPLGSHLTPASLASFRRKRGYPPKS